MNKKIILGRFLEILGITLLAFVIINMIYNPSFFITMGVAGFVGFFVLIGVLMCTPIILYGCRVI